MKTRSCSWLPILLCFAVCFAPLSQTAHAAEKPKATTGDRVGVELAETTSLVTGVAISPLLGVGAVGAWKWVRCSSGQRAHLIARLGPK